MARNKMTSTKVDSIRHKDKRPNIPTEELRDFVAEDEKAPKTMLYPRDPSLDPQLVWKGKDEQDQKDLAVPVVPVYIQEKIHPQALIEDIRRNAPSPLQGAEGDRGGSPTRGEGSGFGDQLNLFADFNGGPIEFEQKVEFYQHEQNWANRMILGDSLLVMTSLAEKEGLKGKVQTIYFDPPYGIKFGSNWQVSTRKRDVKDGKAEDATRQPEQIRAFRDCWRIGVHSYLAYIRDILTAARELLTETGSIFLQIGDENAHLVRSVLDEVFGSDNFVSLITCAKTTGTTGRLLANTADYLLWYAKDTERVKYRPLYREKSIGGEGGEMYTMVELPDGKRRRLTREELFDPNKVPKDGKICRLADLTSPRVREARTGYYPIEIGGKQYLPRKGEWKTHRDGIERLRNAGRLALSGDTPAYVRRIDDFPAFSITNIWDDIGAAMDKLYVVQTGTKMIERPMLLTTDPGDLVLDPTCGSGTTAYVAEQWGRRWITIDTSRVALALARTRLMTAKYPYYYLADDYPQITQMNADEEIKTYLRQSAKSADHSCGDIKKGFVYKRVPHVTLKSIANNPDIREGMKREEIEAAIAKHADTETLYDQPYEDNKRVRVAGPFTVESLSPHRVLSTDEDGGTGVSPVNGHRRDGGATQQDFATMILDNLRKAGVQNTKKNERLKFETLNPHAGTWIHAVGTYLEGGTGVPPVKNGSKPSPPVGLPPRSPSAPSKGEGVLKRVAVSLGPEHGTVGPMQVKEAAKEAVQGVGFDVLIVCGFAFDPHVSEEVKRYGKLTVLAAKMNPDLAMGDELLKKTGAGNLFMVFGEPDIDLKKQKDGTLVAELKGLDVYDPTTGAIRSNSTDDIACWFIDTDYNGESFFVRHAYFTGSAKDDDGPYDKLKRALRAEIDEAAWSSLYSTTSRPFAKPTTGKIAVKVINHYGDEVLKVFSV